MTTIQQVELGVLGPLQVRQFGLPVAIPGAKPRAVLTMLGLHAGSVVAADVLVELLWGDEPPRTAAKALQTHISALRRALGDGFVVTQGTGWSVRTADVDATRYSAAAASARAAMSTGNVSEAVARFDEALRLWRGSPELPDGRRGRSERTRWIEDHAALVEDRADALLATGRAAEIIGELEAAIADAPLRERRWGHLMLALYRAGRQGEALAAFQRVRSLLAEELGVDPGPELRRLEAAVVAQDDSLELPVVQHHSVVTRAVTFLLTDIEGSTAAWERDADAMAVALARHDEIVEQVVTSRGGRLVKTRGEGDATFSVFDRPSGAAAAAVELQEAMRHEPWEPADPIRIRVALHTGEVELRDGDYFGRAVNRAARLRSVADGGQILCSGATAELVIDSLADDVVLADLGTRQLKNLARPERVFELRLESADESRPPTVDAPIERPVMPPVLAGPGPFVGRAGELELLLAGWQATLDTGARAVLIAGEPGVGKTRLAGEWSRRAYEQGAVVLYGRCDEDLGAPYQPFAEALRSLLPCMGPDRLRRLRGVEALLPLVPGLTDVLPELASPTRADADTERYALFDAVVAVMAAVSASTPVVLVLDDLHWAAKPTLLLLRHLLRFGEHARVQIVGTYRSTDLDRSHPLAAMLADLNRDGTADRLQLGGLDEGDVTAYLAAAGYDDEDLARALASVTGGNPFFLIEALRHVDESGGRWDPSTLPQGVREAVTRRLSRLSDETNKALGAAAVVGSRFAVDLVERVVDRDLVDAFDEACKAGIVIEEPGGRYRFNHALVRQSLLAELASVRRMRLHQRIAVALESEPSGGQERSDRGRGHESDDLLAELAYHYFECAWAGNAAKAVDYCRRAADQAMARLAYEGAADLYDKALHALEELDDDLPDREQVQGELLIARCEALLAAGDVATATSAVAQLRTVAGDSGRLAAWGTCFDGQLRVLTDPERLDEVESAVAAAASTLATLDDAAGEAKAHTVRATCLGRLGRIGDCESALDQALTAARRAREHRRVNNVLANAPLAALWGPNSVPRAGGRCLDVVRLLRITTGSPVVEATSTRCQGVLDAFRGRAAAGRQLIDSARRSLADLGMRHSLLEVEQFAGIVELVADEPTAAEEHFRKAYNGFRRMGLEADTAETAALLARACLALGREAEADELCTESERLAGHALKASITWRTVRAQLLARGGALVEARRVAQEAVTIAEHTDALVDHGDACLALAVVLGIAGDVPGSKAAAERATELYELKGATALVEKARTLLDERQATVGAEASEVSSVVVENACVQTVRRIDDAWNREAWDELEQLVAPTMSVDNRRRVVGLSCGEMSSSQWIGEVKQFRDTGMVRYKRMLIDTRGDLLALTRVQVTTLDVSAGAPQDEMLALCAVDQQGRLALQVSYDVVDIDSAVADLDVHYQRTEAKRASPTVVPENACTRAVGRVDDAGAREAWDELDELFASTISVESRRKIVGLSRVGLSPREWADLAQQFLEAGVARIDRMVLAVRGDRLALFRTRLGTADGTPGAAEDELLHLMGLDEAGRISLHMSFDVESFYTAIEELDARYLEREASPYADTWTTISESVAAFNRHEYPAWTSDAVTVDHRRVTAFAPGDRAAYVRATWEQTPDLMMHIEAVHRLNHVGAVITYVASGTSRRDFAAEWRGITVTTLHGDRIHHSEQFDQSDLDAALARFDELDRPVMRLENLASRVDARFQESFTARDWVSMAEILDEDLYADDRRRTVNAGTRRGRDAKVADMRATADLGTHTATSTVLAVRGQRLALVRIRLSGRDNRPEAFHTEMLGVVEIDPENRMTARVLFDPGDHRGAFAELDARYAAGEAAAHSRTWSIVSAGCAALNRHEIPATTEDFTSVDHRAGTTFAPGDLKPYIRESAADTPGIKLYVEAVYRLSDAAAVIATVTTGTSTRGFDAEWRSIGVIGVANGLMSCTELFDEADLDDALARFDELARPDDRLQNAATRVFERFAAQFTAGEWASLAQILAEDYVAEDRRSVVGAGLLNGRDAVLADLRATTELARTAIRYTPIAVRGDRFLLNRIRLSSLGDGDDEFHSDVFSVVEITEDNRAAAHVVFDADDLVAALTELDTRYVSSLAEATANAYSAISTGFGLIGRGRIPAITPDFIDVDHRAVTGFEPGGLTDYLRAGFSDLAHSRMYIEVVHRLTEHGAVFTHVAEGVSRDGQDVEWRVTDVVTLDGDRFARCELFDDVDLDAAMARFDELTGPIRLENTASRVYERYLGEFMAGDWNAMADTIAENVSNEDRRRIVNGGTQRGRAAVLANMRAIAEVGVTHFESTVVAVRGEHLALGRYRVSGGTQPEAFGSHVLTVVGVDEERRFVTGVAFDVGDIDAAMTELDAQYLAGEAAPHARAWSTVAKGYEGFNRRQLSAMTTDFASIDHRRSAAFAPGELLPYMQAAWEDSPDTAIRVEAVHRLSDRGAVVTHFSAGRSREGFHAEWRDIAVAIVDGDAFSRMELFDATDLDAALARFDELIRPTPRLANPASRACARFRDLFAARDWSALQGLLAKQFDNVDRRHVVSAGTRRGPTSVMDDLRAAAELGVLYFSASEIASRGDRLVLTRGGASYGERVGAFRIDTLQVAEIDADERITAIVMFEPDDIDAAIAELDFRYRAGEAAPYAHVWNVIAGATAAFNRRAPTPVTSDCVVIDHRLQATLAGGETDDLTAYLNASWELTPDLRAHIETVHALNNRGALVTTVTNGTTSDGFGVDWRQLTLMTVRGGLGDRCEIFDESALDVALERFGELSRTMSRLENAATGLWAQLADAFNRRALDHFVKLSRPDGVLDDRRRGVRDLRDGSNRLRVVQTLFEYPADWRVSVEHVAVRGSRLCLSHLRIRDFDVAECPITIEYLTVLELGDDGLACAFVNLDVDDLTAAIAELDARYLVGEAAAYAQIWSLVVRTYAGFNRHELSKTTPDWVNIDHRLGVGSATGDMNSYVTVMRDVVPDVDTRIEAVHRLSDIGAVFTHTERGTSADGFEAEWREVALLTFTGDAIDRCELFDESDLEAALARFDERSRSVQLLSNAATRTVERFWNEFEARNWTAMASLISEDTVADDRRPVVGSVVLQGREANLNHYRALASVGTHRVTTTVLATRGHNVALALFAFSGGDPDVGAYRAEALAVVEIDHRNAISARVIFDADDLDAAYTELDKRYAAGEAAPCADTWSVVAAAYAAMNRHELPVRTSDWRDVDHRRLAMIGPGELMESVRASWDLTPDIRMRIETVHRVDAHGAVFTRVTSASSDGGGPSEWRAIDLVTVEGGVASACEIFDESDLDAALARFDELDRALTVLANSASRAAERFSRFGAADPDTLAQIFAADFVQDDRRRVVGAGVRHGRVAEIDDLRAFSDVGLTNVAFTFLGTRGDRLALARSSVWGGDSRPTGVQSDMLTITEVDGDGRITALVIFDVDDLDAAYAELDARYLAGEAAPHAETWSALVKANAAFNRREMPPTTRDWVNVDNRRGGMAFAPGDMSAYMRATWDVASEVSNRIVGVHRLGGVGAVFTQHVRATSGDGFTGEWRDVVVLAVEGERLSRCEVFDEADLGTALTRFDELIAPKRLHNEASRVGRRLRAAFAARDWNGMADLYSRDVRNDDRRRVVNAGLRIGRESMLADMRAAADMGVEHFGVTEIATRGERLVLVRAGSPYDDRPGGFRVDNLAVGEIDADGRISAQIMFDQDDLDAAFAELDARYLAGEAAAHGHAWSVVKDAYAAVNRHERPKWTTDFESIDHRKAIAVAPGELQRYVEATWADTPGVGVFIEAVHRVNDVAVLVTHVTKGTSEHDFEAEWRIVTLSVLDGDFICRSEMFDEDDLDLAIARFDELAASPRLENTATRARHRIADAFNRRDLDDFLARSVPSGRYEDRRRGLRDAAEGAELTKVARALFEMPTGCPLTTTPVAVRGSRLALTRDTYRDPEDAVVAEHLTLTEIGESELICDSVLFDPDDLDAAFAELDARYLAGEAAPHAWTWSLTVDTYAAFNRREVPSTTPDWVNVDHRRGVSSVAGDIDAYVRELWSMVPDARTRIEVVHRLNDVGAVLTSASSGRSSDGFAAEWKMLHLFVFDRAVFSRCEMFDEADLDAALARFDELTRDSESDDENGS